MPTSNWNLIGNLLDPWPENWFKNQMFTNKLIKKLDFCISWKHKVKTFLNQVSNVGKFEEFGILPKLILKKSYEMNSCS